MPYATTAHTKLLYFAPESADPPVSNRTTKPPLSTSHLFGTVGSVRLRNTRDVVWHEIADSGVWKKNSAFPQRDDQVLEATLTELSEVAWEVILGDKINLTAGEGPFIPGNNLAQNGWTSLQVYKYPNEEMLTVDLWSYLEVDEFEIPETGLVTVTLKITKLHSPLNSGNLSNVL